MYSPQASAIMSANSLMLWTLFDFRRPLYICIWPKGGGHSIWERPYVRPKMYLPLAITFIKVPPQQNEHIVEFAFKRNAICPKVIFVKSDLSPETKFDLLRVTSVPFHTRFFIRTIVWKNEVEIWPKPKNKLRTIWASFHKLLTSTDFHFD